MKRYKALIAYGFSPNRAIIVDAENEGQARDFALTEYARSYTPGVAPVCLPEIIHLIEIHGKLAYRIKYQYGFMLHPSHISVLANDPEDAMDEALAELFRNHGPLANSPIIHELKEI